MGCEKHDIDTEMSGMNICWLYRLNVTYGLNKTHFMEKCMGTSKLGRSTT
jgi:hypothetical protein